MAGAFTVKVNMGGLLQALDNYPHISEVEVAHAEYDAAQLMVNDLKQYPPPPANSRYVRTGTLGRGWEGASFVTSVSARRVVTTGLNPVRYVVFVQGERQARVHKGKWKTVEQIKRKNQAAIRALFLQAIQRIARRIEMYG